MNSRWKRLLIDGLTLLLVIVIAVPLLRIGYRRYTQMAYPLTYTELVEQYSKEFDLTPSLIYGVIYTESRFQPEAVSSAGAKGLMQITDSTFEWVLTKLGEENGDVFDPETNIRCGAKILQILCGEFDNIETVLAAYNAGIGNVGRWLEDSAYSEDGKTLHTIPFPETREYVVRVLNAQKMYQTLYEIP